ncbi:calcineurin-like phosphoesterase C-terminal domain-containing protein [Brachybacterium sp. GCM10030268]|uniref:calcineurin-like phosphoesterase C-terminal domain-containing protein n=1 Tax=Brachybacterium sp. GCM10030268 TaxID=3273382 RepID=UPI0036122D65
MTHPSPASPSSAPHASATSPSSISGAASSSAPGSSRAARSSRARRRLASTLALGASAVLCASIVPTAANADPAGSDVPSDAYQGEVEVGRGQAADPETLQGVVFDDKDKDSAQDRGEKGIAGVTVSNGREVVTTAKDGSYELPVYENMTVFVTQPAGWQVPVDEHNFAQFSYNHLPEGSTELKYGGLEPTGELPEAVNFPMGKSKATKDSQQSCPIAADTQAYDLTQMGYARDGAVKELTERHDYGGCGVLMLGDNVGDDLSLYPELKDIYADVNGPIRAAMGNHDLDFDATESSHSNDTFRQHIGPAYFSYDVGEAHFVVLDSIEYPNTETDAKYLEKIDQEQLDWLAKDLENVPDDKKIVLATHAPVLDRNGVIIDNATDLYDVLEGRDVTTVGGHTHTLENYLPGDQRAEWAEDGIDELPHQALIAGAVSGDWYSGGLDENGLPYAYMNDGARPGIMTLGLDGADLSARYTVRGEDDDEQLTLGVNSPTWRDWAEQAQAWQDDDKAGEMSELGDPNTVTREDLAGGTWLTADFFGGSTEATVEVSIDGGSASPAEHTQPAEGEALAEGFEYSDTVAATQNLRSSGNVTTSSAHLWRHQLSEDLAAGTHTAEITATDRNGNSFTESVRFTVTD